jgi:hypothetical protein
VDGPLYLLLLVRRPIHHVRPGSCARYASTSTLGFTIRKKIFILLWRFNLGRVIVIEVFENALMCAGQIVAGRVVGRRRRGRSVR